MENRTSKRPQKIGMVVSNSMDKTIVVKIATLVKHPEYHKMMKRTIRIKAHDENNQAKIGDRVLVMQTRPLSKTKRYRLVEILEEAK